MGKNGHYKTHCFPVSRVDVSKVRWGGRGRWAVGFLRHHQTGENIMAISTDAPAKWQGTCPELLMIDGNEPGCRRWSGEWANKNKQLMKVHDIEGLMCVMRNDAFYGKWNLDYLLECQNSGSGVFPAHVQTRARVLSFSIMFVMRFLPPVVHFRWL